VPTLSQIEAWSTDHLDTAATHWSETAETWEHAFTIIHREAPNPGGTQWIGAAADAAVLRTGTDRVVVVGAADSLHSAAQVARYGAQEIVGARELALQAVNDARASGFNVGEDLSVTSRLSGGPPAVLAARQAQAQAFAAAIRAGAENLVAVDTEVAGKVSAAIAGVNSAQFGDTPAAPTQQKKPTIQAVDNHTVKEDPPPKPPEPNPNYPGRDVNGRFLPGNTGSADGATAAQQVLEDRAARTGKELITQQIRVAVIDPQTGQPMIDPRTGGPLYRYYDALEPTSTPGHYTGIEVKSGSASLTPNQRLFDGRVNSGLPATGTLNGQSVTIDRTLELRGPAYAPGDGAGLGRAAGVGGVWPPPPVIEPPPPEPFRVPEAPRPPTTPEPPLRLPLGGPATMPGLPTFVEPPGVHPGHEELPLLGEDPEEFFDK
jgi:hypothetical protein